MNSIKIVENATTLLFSIAVALAIGEIGARFLLPPETQIASTGNQYQFYKFDEKLGWSNGENRKGRFARGEFEYDISINKHGMRYRDIEKDKSKVIRVAVLGDSFTWGIGVGDQDRFTELAEQATQGRFELLNFGVSGYGPIQHYLDLDRILSFNPDAVLLTFCLGNDFADNVFWKRYGYYKPFVSSADDPSLKIEGYPLPRTKDFWQGGIFLQYVSEYSRFLRELRPHFSNFFEWLSPAQAGLIGASEDQSDIYGISRDSMSDYFADSMVQINAKLLLRIAQKLSEANVKVAVVLVPTKCEYGRCKQSSSQDSIVSRNLKSRDRLLGSLKALNIAAIDPTLDIELTDFWINDGHWKQSGHRKVAGFVVAWLERTFGDRSH